MCRPVVDMSAEIGKATISTTIPRETMMGQRSFSTSRPAMSNSAALPSYTPTPSSPEITRASNLSAAATASVPSNIPERTPALSLDTAWKTGPSKKSGAGITGKEKKIISPPPEYSFLPGSSSENAEQSSIRMPSDTLLGRCESGTAGVSNTGLLPGNVPQSEAITKAPALQVESLDVASGSAGHLLMNIASTSTVSFSDVSEVHEEVHLNPASRRSEVHMQATELSPLHGGADDKAANERLQKELRLQREREEEAAFLAEQEALNTLQHEEEV